MVEMKEMHQSEHWQSEKKSIAKFEVLALSFYWYFIIYSIFVRVWTTLQFTTNHTARSYTITFSLLVVITNGYVGFCPFLLEVLLVLLLGSPR